MRRKRPAVDKVEEHIGYHFADRQLLELALTHSSASVGNPAGSYQRLEFLGDRVLGLAISDMLLRAYPKATEGELSYRLADLVRAETCAAAAHAMQLDAAVQIGKGKAAGLTQTILADVCESVIGAVFLDGGFAAASALVERFWADRMRTLVRPLRDPKTLLQEWAQARGLPTPSYRELDRTGPHHDPEFRIAVDLPDRPPAEGVGRSKRAAEQAAAASMLAREGIDLGTQHG